MSDPAEPRATDKPPLVLAALGMAIFAALALVMMRWAHSALAHDNLPTALVAGLAALSLVCFFAIGVANRTRPEPRAEYTARGLEIRPAMYVSKLIVAASVSFVVAMTLGAVLYATGNLDFHPGSRSERGFADRMFGLALAMPFIIGIPYLPAMLTWIKGERKPWHRNPTVLLSPAGVQIERLGVARFAPWEKITDVGVVSNRSQPVLEITQRNGPKLVCEKLPLLGGPWLVDTITTYWQHPPERSRLSNHEPMSPERQTSAGRGGIPAVALVGLILLGGGLGTIAYRLLHRGGPMAPTSTSSAAGCEVDGAPTVVINENSGGEPVVRIPVRAGWSELSASEIPAGSPNGAVVRGALVNNAIRENGFSPDIVVTLQKYPDTTSPPRVINDVQDLKMRDTAVIAERSSREVCGNVVFATRFSSRNRLASGTTTAGSSLLTVADGPDGSRWVATATILTSNTGNPEYLAQLDALSRGFQVSFPGR